MQQANPKFRSHINDTVDSLPTGYGAIVSALFAVLVVQCFRVNLHRSIVLMCSEILFVSGVIVAVCFCVRKWTVQANDNWQLRRAIYSSQLGAAVVAVVFCTWQLVARKFGLGDANEIVALLSLQYLTLLLALVGRVPGYAQASQGLSGALVFFVCCMTQQFEIFFLAGAFTVTALWGLLGIYWSRLDSKAIDGRSKMLSVHGSFVGIASLLMLLAVGVASLVPMSDAATGLRGFMPFSGGEDGYQDQFARDGVGDGDMLTGGDNATTTGAVDTDQFIEDHKPSLYDVMSEQYEGPIAKPRRNRTIALASVAKHLHDLKQSEMAGKTFRTMRKSGEPTNKKLENRTTEALFFVEGSTPVRFATTHYQHFDGWDWTTVPSDLASPISPRINLRKQGGKPVFWLKQNRKPYLTDSRIHRVKLMRLETSSLPMAAFLDSWHISKVDNLDFFRWDDHGQIRFDGDSIASQTVIAMKSFVPNYHLIPASPPDVSQSRSESSNSPYLQIPAGIQRSAIQGRVDRWTKQNAVGWEQVDAIVRRIRHDFELNNSWQADPEVDSSIDLFLNRQGGPAYMFATTCAIALRSAGYKTRLASGFVVRESDFDRVSGQSAVDRDNVHMWPEVCLDGQFWIPVEPTPGYPLPYRNETLWQKLTATIFSFCRWIYQHPVSTVSTLALVTLVIAFRFSVVTTGLLIWWYGVRTFWPAALLSETRRLIDARFWAAGATRPTSQTINHWYLQVDPNLPCKFFELWNLCNFSETSPAVGIDMIVRSCDEQVQLLTSQKIRRFRNTNLNNKSCELT